jgi:hypothetical protein
MRTSARKGPILDERIPVKVSIPESFLESIFTGFSVMRSGKEDVCVRYSMGSEANKSFLPFYDHRPAVIESARAFDREPSPDNALTLLNALGKNAELELKRRSVRQEDFYFVNFWPTAERWPAAVLSGNETDLQPEAMANGLCASGTDALWYWFGILPLEQAAAGRGLKVVHVSLARKPASETAGEEPEEPARPKRARPPR